jgi:hypothetical protein
MHGMLPGFSCRDLEAVLVKYNEDEAEKSIVMCPSGSEAFPQQQSLRNWCNVVRRKTSVWS